MERIFEAIAEDGVLEVAFYTADSGYQGFFSIPSFIFPLEEGLEVTDDGLLRIGSRHYNIRDLKRLKVELGLDKWEGENE